MPTSSTAANGDGAGVPTPPETATEPPRSHGPTGLAGDAAHVRLSPGRPVPGTRYKLVRWLGEGGMGVVYEVEHVDIERRAALKVLRADRPIDDLVARKFRDEARGASRVGSEYIVEIYDFGELPDGRLMFTMELLQGHSLVEELDHTPMAPERLIPILRQCCKGLAAAHEAGIVHRDIKPENILLTRSRIGRRDHVKIVDFGIAKMAPGEEGAEGPAPGTPHYMAPELCMGLQYDGRADMYSLGCTAYELLTGRPPFGGETVADLIRGHLEVEPEPPSVQLPAGTVPAELERVIMRCLAKQPEQRFADMADLEAALCEAQIATGLRTVWDDLPLPEVDAPRREQLERSMPRKDQHGPKSLWFAVAAVVGLVLVLVAIGLWRTGQPQEPSDTVAVQQLVTQAQEAAARADYVYPASEGPSSDTAYRKILALEVLASSGVEVAARRAKTLRQEFAQTLVRLGDRYWDRPAGQPFATEYYAQALLFDPDNAQARSRVVISPTQLMVLQRKAAEGNFTAGELEAVAPLALLADRDEDQALEEFHDYRARKKSRSLRQAAAERRFARANAKLRKSTAEEVVAATIPDEEAGAAEEVKARSKRHSTRAQELARRGEAALDDGELLAAETLFNQALAADHLEPTAHVGLCRVYLARKADDRALRSCREAVRLQPRAADPHLWLGDVYRRTDRQQNALIQYEIADALGSDAARERLGLAARQR